MRPGREPDRADQIGQRIHLPASTGVLRVHRVVRGQHRHQTARPRQTQALEDEVVVHRLPRRIVHRVVQGDVAERDVPDRGVEVSFGQPGVRERLTTDSGARIQAAADRRGERVQLDPSHLRAVGGQTDERAQPRPRLQHLPAGEAQAAQRLPHLTDNQRIGVVRVDRGARRRIPLRLIQQATELSPLACPLGLGVVKDLGQRTPRRPPSQHPLLTDPRQTALVGQRPHHVDGGDVRPEPRLRTRRRQVVLRGRHKPQPDHRR